MKYSLKERKLIKQIKKSPYFWKTDSAWKDGNLIKVELNKNLPNVLNYSELMHPLNKEITYYVVHSGRITLNDLLENHQWIGDKKYAEKIYDDALDRFNLRNYVVIDGNLYTATKNYDTDNFFEFCHLSSVNFYNVKTKKLEYIYVNNLTQEKLKFYENNKDFNYEDIQIKNLKIYEFKWMTKEEATQYMIEKIYCSLKD